jgi:hypothetical protein
MGDHACADFSTNTNGNEKISECRAPMLQGRAVWRVASGNDELAKHTKDYEACE